MGLTKGEKERLLSFLGYGRLSAQIWFLGMEEKLPRDVKPDKEFQTRSRFGPTMDLYEAHRLLSRFNLLTGERNLSRVWIWMAKLARKLLYEGACDWSNLEKAKDYVRVDKKLGSLRHKETFLIEFFPVPACSRGKRGWTKSHKRHFGKRAKYEEEQRLSRIPSIKSLVFRHKPRYLIAYGKEHWRYYCKVVGLPENEFELVRGTRNRVKVARLGEMCVVLLPFLGNGRFSHEDGEKLFEELKS